MKNGDTVFNDDVFRQFVMPHRRHALPRLRRFVQTLVGWKISNFFLTVSRRW